MKSHASRSRSQRACVVAVGAVAVAVLGASWAHAQAAPPAAAAAVAGPAPAYHFPNLVLRTHEGRNVRFYDDLVKGKIVLINFMYADCKKR